jgi:hypothetical protein
MAVGLPFTSAHVASLATRAAELEQIGEDLQDPRALIRAARLYKLAARITDDIGEGTAVFTRSDLARVRNELRTLATDAAASGMLGDHGLADHGATDTTGALTRAFREVALRIEQRVVAHEVRVRTRPDAGPRA